METSSRSVARREFLKFVAASPFLPYIQNGPGSSDLITDPAGAMNVFDFEEVAHRRVSPGHWAYMASGVDDDATLRANRDIFKNVQFAPRRRHAPHKEH